MRSDLTIETFEMLKGGKEYRRLVAVIERIFGVTIFFGTDGFCFSRVFTNAMGISLHSQYDARLTGHTLA